MDLQEAHRVLDIEARAILQLKNKLNGGFSKALDLLQTCEGKIIVTGIGKSGQIGRKIASTMSSTGAPAIPKHSASLLKRRLRAFRCGQIPRSAKDYCNAWVRGPL